MATTPLHRHSKAYYTGLSSVFFDKLPMSTKGLDFALAPRWSGWLSAPIRQPTVQALRRWKSLCSRLMRSWKANNLHVKSLSNRIPLDTFWRELLVWWLSMTVNPITSLRHWLDEVSLLQVSNKDDVAVGRIRQDLSQDGTARDQIRKGAALNAIQIAEKLL
ncbi:hypothetical protein OPV22_019995 [Ensete ventricosum]|uniref:Rubisco LSMT substrate-binding domain-containing protein n=1 Tax=Ensete ventricosum TaxID=4639 RepID=A0AAV8QHQ2_ENSVE|nr:hypothetical protein OPV22_019995 [Ensete ventricosum]